MDGQLYMLGFLHGTILIILDLIINALVHRTFIVTKRHLTAMIHSWVLITMASSHCTSWWGCSAPVRDDEIVLVLSCDACAASCTNPHVHASFRSQIPPLGLPIVAGHMHEVLPCCHWWSHARDHRAVRDHVSVVHTGEARQQKN